MPSDVMKRSEKKSKRLSRVFQGIKSKIKGQLGSSEPTPTKTANFTKQPQLLARSSEADLESRPDTQPAASPLPVALDSISFQQGPSAPPEARIRPKLGKDFSKRSTPRVPYSRPDLSWKEETHDERSVVGSSPLIDGVKLETSKASDGTISENELESGVAGAKPHKKEGRKHDLAATKTTTKPLELSGGSSNATPGSEPRHDEDASPGQPSAQVAETSRVQDTKQSPIQATKAAPAPRPKASSTQATKITPAPIPKPATTISSNAVPSRARPPKDSSGPLPGAATHTDSSGQTSYLSPAMKSNYTTPGYEWASKATGYDWASRQTLYGYDNPTMGEAYRRELQRRENHLTATQEKVQQMKEAAIGEKSKEPGIKMGYMYRA
ncbi:hypothetical protein GQ53DRAFT_836154 [Thozetella sp. PMI_491]|nr:hypothetical protein GQ53DRAFT_836154 [Thozetella sp. PMI_491]